MPKGHAPSIFVSSTCYDLNQIRLDLGKFIETIGCDPVLSELKTFPVIPEAGTIEACLDAVNQRADIFILVVGGRYGSQTDNGKSITNLEYLQAKAKGIPVYVFVLKSILHNMPPWKDNPEADFSSVVDSVKLFEFVESLQDSGEGWVFSFENAQDIIEVLKKQLSYLFMDGLELRKKVRGSQLPESLLALNSKAIQLVIECPFAWEYRFFSEVLSNEIDNLKDMRWDLKYNIRFGKVVPLVSLNDIVSWASNKIDELLSIVATSTDLVNTAYQDAIGEPGVPADLEHLVYVAKRIAETYKSAIEWTLEFKSVKIEDDFKRLIDLYSEFTNNVIQEIEELSERLHVELERAVNAYAETGSPQTVDIKFVLTAHDTTELMAEMERLKRKYNP